jgi:hypothetical protein
MMKYPDFSAREVESQWVSTRASADAWMDDFVNGKEKKRPSSSIYRARRAKSPPRLRQF